MAPIPLQRDTVQRPGTIRAGYTHGPRPASRTSLPGIPLAPSAARRFVRAALAEWTGLGVPAAVGFSDRLADDAVTVTNELVTNAVVHAGTTVDLVLRLEEEGGEEPSAALVLEVTDHHPARPVSGDEPEAATGAPPRAETGEPTGLPDPAEYGRGLQLVATLAESWGITYRTGLKTVWARLPVDDWSGPPAPPDGDSLRRGLRAAEILAPAARRTERDDAVWDSRGAPAFLAEASDLLAGQLDEDLVAAIAGQLLVPRLADWCAIWLEAEGGGPGAEPRLARVWHSDETGTEPLRTALEREPLRLPADIGPGPVHVPVPWSAQRGPYTGNAPGAEGGPHPQDGPPAGDAPHPGSRDGAALAFRITAGGRALGTVLVGREGVARMPEAVASLIEDFVRRLGLAVGAARAYTRQATISRILQRGLLPSKVAEIPGVTSALVYEPSDDGVVGGDFYDIFPCPGDRWCFVLGDVQGSGPEAAVVTGLARPWLRLLSREGFGVGEVLDRLNRLLLDDAMEAAEAAALMVAAAGGQQLHDGTQSRFLSLLYGEVVPLPGGGVRCTVASAGHPLPLLLRPDGSVRPAAEPQVLLGVVEDVAYESQVFDLAPGDSLLCVTDGVTERRSGPLMFDDGDGLAQVLAGCAGLPAEATAERIRRAVHEFAEQPPDDDVALLVLHAG
ncbi:MULTISPECIES: ATP-binding SpoIIE family protein phosphatase [unclassified Streptomyces]|uniref:ATP-binding SpoIIE family protein phosphatase n=1 Tax=unclassified Streptomyces TaxID=2593676 RepID=UPI000823DBF6|nr:ATP-binding SpoIIE family protein phosphatase [Streptomyces sp. AmelKG-D3]MYU00427.1 SpoIIE family protein phosphatase [Streptomyces sp. SID8350]SCK06792.1 Serine phosphatase RsbU, regulator of sigma subunit [Streptomyces sp. AmelKG-D3]